MRFVGVCQFGLARFFRGEGGFAEMAERCDKFPEWDSISNEECCSVVYLLY